MHRKCGRNRLRGFVVMLTVGNNTSRLALTFADTLKCRVTAVDLVVAAMQLVASTSESVVDVPVSSSVSLCRSFNAARCSSAGRRRADGVDVRRWPPPPPPPPAAAINWSRRVRSSGTAFITEPPVELSRRGHLAAGLPVGVTLWRR